MTLRPGSSGCVVSCALVGRKISREAAGVSPVTGDPAGLGQVAERINLANEVLRIRKIARLDQKGLEPPEIAAELERSNPSGDWRLEEVLVLMGRYPDADMVASRDRYQRISEEVSSNELVDVDQELAEMQAMALRNLRDLAEYSNDDKIRMAASVTILKLNGVNSVQVDKKIVEHKMDDKMVAALLANAETKARRPLLPDLIAEDKLIIDSQVIEDEP